MGHSPPRPNARTVPHGVADGQIAAAYEGERRSTGLCRILALLSLAFASAPGFADDEGVDVAIRTVTLDVVHGTLTSLSLSEGAVLDTDAEGRIPVPDIVRIDALNATARPPVPRPQLTLTGGDTIRGRVTGSREDAVVIETMDLGAVEIPLEAAARFDTAKAFQPEYAESVSWLGSTDAPDEDQVLLTNGDVLRGFVSSISAAGVSIDTDLGEVAVPHRLVLVVRFAAPALAPPEPLHLTVTCRVSGKITVTDINWSTDVVSVQLRQGPRVSIAPERITRIDVVKGRWEWLSGHRPISHEHTPMLALGWPYRVDRNVLGGPITVAGTHFERGLGVHSRSSLAYDLRGAYEEFVTFFGIDDDSGSYADVSVYILVDGRRRFDQDHVRPGRLSGPVRIDVARANRLELKVDFGDNGDLQDRLDWVEAALVRKRKP